MGKVGCAVDWFWFVSLLAVECVRRPCLDDAVVPAHVPSQD